MEKHELLIFRLVQHPIPNDATVLGVAVSAGRVNALSDAQGVAVNPGKQLIPTFSEELAYSYSAHCLSPALELEAGVNHTAQMSGVRGRGTRCSRNVSGWS